MDMKHFRQQIDRVDGQLLALFERRMRISRAIGAYKRANGLPVFDPAREEQLIKDRQARLGDPALAAAAEAFFRCIMDISKDEQRQADAPPFGGNLYLTGLCGCGKSTLGRLLAARQRRPFFDTDERVEQIAGVGIPDLFSQMGEEAFRALEARAIREAARLRGAVVATGGGSILDERNIGVMRGSGRILFIDRPTDAILRDLDMRNRPLAPDADALRSLAREREALYNERCDIRLQNDGTIAQALSAIEGMLGEAQ